jgi:hypothetical protein
MRKFCPVFGFLLAAGQIFFYNLAAFPFSFKRQQYIDEATLVGVFELFAKLHRGVGIHFHGNARTAQLARPPADRLDGLRQCHHKLRRRLAGNNRTSIPAPDQTVNDNVFEFNFIENIDEQFATVEQNLLNTITLENKGLIIRNNVFIGMEMIGSFTRPETKNTEQHVL